MQQGRDQTAGGGFAVAACNCNAALGIDHPGQQFGAVPDLKARLAGSHQFRVLLGDGAADHHQRITADASADRIDRGGALLLEDSCAALAQLLREHGLTRIGAGDCEVALGQDACQGRHPDAPHTDEVHRPIRGQ